MAGIPACQRGVTDQSWIPDYTKHVRGLLAKHGGKWTAGSLVTA